MTEAHRKILKDLYDDQYVNKDHLPYTEDFDRLVARFNELTHQNLSHYEIWVALTEMVN